MNYVPLLLSVINILYNIKIMSNKKNWNTENFRRWENENLGISIPPDYTGKDIINVKPKSQHLHTKLKVFRRIG